MVGPVSVLKPLAGLDLGLEENLRTFSSRIILRLRFCLRCGMQAIRRLRWCRSCRREYPEISSRLIVTGESAWANAKVFSLDRMLAAAKYDLLVMSDSDISRDSRLDAHGYG